METEAMELSEASKEWMRLFVLRLVSEQVTLEARKYLATPDSQLLERMVRVEEALLQQQRYMEQRFEQIDKRFEQIDKRFEDMQCYMDKRFEQIDKRFEDMQRYMDKRFEQIDKRFEDIHRYMDKRFAAQQWFMGIGFGLIISILGLIKFAPL